MLWMSKASEKCPALGLLALVPYLQPPPARMGDPEVKLLSTLGPGKLPLISLAEPREGLPLALQLSSNRREREVGQVPAGVGRILALAPGEPWFLSQLQPEREAVQSRTEMGFEKGGRGQAHARRAEYSQPVPSARHHWYHAVGTPYRAFSKHQALDSRPGPSHPSMKRTTMSAGWKGPVDHCPGQSSWTRF